MCTVYFAATSGKDFVLAGNRDERHTRPAAEPPTVRNVRGVRVIAPTDPEAGGTWVSVNEHGVALTVLNAYELEAGWSPDPPAHSRGQIVLSLSDCSSVAEVERRLRGTDLPLTRTQPFDLLAAGPGPVARGWRWTGQVLEARPIEGPDVLVSTPVEFVRGTRRAALQDLLDGAPAPDRSSLRARFASHEPDRRGPAVCMHREEAATVAHTQVRVDASWVSLSFAAGTACSGSEWHHVQLQRRPP